MFVVPRIPPDSRFGLDIDTLRCLSVAAGEWAEQLHWGRDYKRSFHRVLENHHHPISSLVRVALVAALISGPVPPRGSQSHHRRDRSDDSAFLRIEKRRQIFDQIKRGARKNTVKMYTVVGVRTNDFKPEVSESKTISGKMYPVDWKYQGAINNNELSLNNMKLDSAKSMSFCMLKINAVSGSGSWWPRVESSFSFVCRFKQS